MGEGTLWRSAQDPDSGRTYYYHVETRETQWSKPLELASPKERKAIEDKERQQREFFAAMEANIMNSIAAGNFVKTKQEIIIDVPSLETRPAAKDASRRSHMIRTISSMEDAVLVDLVRRVPSTRNVFRQQDDVKDIVFQPEAAEATPTKSRKIPTPETLGVDVSLSLLEATRHSNRSLIMEAKMESKRSLNVIDEFDSLDGSFLHMDLKDSSGSIGGVQDDDVRQGKQTLRREASLGTFLKELPKEGANSMRSIYGASSFDESMLSFRLTVEETEALEELAMVSEEMAKIDSDSLHGFKTSFTTNGDMFLRDIHEDSKNEEETDTEESDFETAAESTKSLDALMDSGAGTPDVGTQMGDTVIIRREALRSTRNPQQHLSQKKLLSKPSMERRNTCGNLYVGSTLSTPDSDATLKCICGVYRAHILNAEMDCGNDDQEYRIFNDLESQQKRSSKKGFSAPVFVVKPPPPSFDDITAFFRDVFYAAKMEPDCLIITLIYIERLIKTTDGKLRPRTSNWRSILFSCMVLASKVWDDLSMWNIDFSETCPTGVQFSLQRINELEIALLTTLDYEVKVPAGEYAKYYFLLRSMLIKSGLGGENMKASDPLDVEGAKRLQHLSSLFQHKATSRRDLMTSISTRNVQQQLSGASAKGKVQLEHVVRM